MKVYRQDTQQRSVRQASETADTSHTSLIVVLKCLIRLILWFPHQLLFILIILFDVNENNKIRYYTLNIIFLQVIVLIY